MRLILARTVKMSNKSNAAQCTHFDRFSFRFLINFWLIIGRIIFANICAILFIALVTGSRFNLDVHMTRSLVLRNLLSIQSSSTLADWDSAVLSGLFLLSDFSAVETSAGCIKVFARHAGCIWVRWSDSWIRSSDILSMRSSNPDNDIPKFTVTFALLNVLELRFDLVHSDEGELEGSLEILILDSNPNRMDA